MNGAFIITIGQEALRSIDEPVNFGLFTYFGASGVRMVVFSALLMAIILFWSRRIFGTKEFSWDMPVSWLRCLTRKKEAGKS